MKQYPWKFKLCRNGIEWYQTEKTLGTNHYFYYFKIWWMGADTRAAWKEEDGDGWLRKVFGWKTVGLHKFWYDCPHAQLNLHWIVIGWSTQRTNMPKDYWK